MRALLWGRHVFRLILLLLFVRVGYAVLPNSFNGWQTSSFRPIPANLLGQFAGDDTLLLHEYGFIAGERREYTRGGSMISVTLWQMRDSTGSYGVYTFFRESGMEEQEAEGSMVMGQGRWLARRGVYVIDARGESLSRDEAPLLLTEIPAVRGREILPQVSDYLPLEGQVPNSTTFMMGPVAFARMATRLSPPALGFHLGAEAAIAQYGVAGSQSRLLLVSYATPQLAARQLQSFEETSPKLDPDDPGPVYIRRTGSLLAFVLDAPQQEVAENLFDGIRYESVITWNERAPTQRDNVGELLLAAFLLTGFCLLVALVAGISFGGVRYLAKKFLPWAVFDRPTQIAIIRLNITDK